MSLYAPAARPQLIEMIAALHRRGERYLRVKLGLPDHKRVSDREHGQLMDYVRSQRIEAARKLVTEHLLGTGELLYRLLSEPSPASKVPTGKPAYGDASEPAAMLAPKKRRGASRTPD